ncbi:alpha-L-fucosidase [Anditalea andensis]|uniref:alpha-L-fucosidase n=1 Tax=Anditalea andensis TaxID=1048983 RepID=A0A074L1E2_9BACT|nr:alpha-L-fucosidase [Anditalea andensis]KEO74315.1 alpha-L-fucosidase [Anditalea andensis]
MTKTTYKTIISCRTLLLVMILVYSTLPSFAQKDNIHQRSTTYQWPEDPLVLEKLDQWQDLKFGIIIHWGLYAVPGIIESWQLCSEDWISRPDSLDYPAYKEWYWGLKEEFAPHQFNPEIWAQTAQDAGMKYLIFTTKHHDGFAMFDTDESDFKITAGPFSDHPKADVSKHIFEAFRQKDFMIGAYYSKPDWHSEDYWWPKYATPNRNNNYDLRKYPERWNSFKQFTHNQINELMSGYGEVDILWLDGGWVRPLNTVNEEVLSWGAPIPEWSQDIDIPTIAAKAREKQPGLLIVDRTVHGPYENYQTPERSIPDDKLDHPWESCIPLGNNWGHVPDDKMKEPEEIIHMLIEIVAKGGSMVLGIGPKPDGTIGERELIRLNEIGAWMKGNGAALYATRPATHYRDGETFFTQNKNGDINAITRLEKSKALPSHITWTGNEPEIGSSVKVLATGEQLKWVKKDGKVLVRLPPSFRKKHAAAPAISMSYRPA